METKLRLNPSKTRDCNNSGLKILSFDAGPPRATTFIVKGKSIDIMLMANQELFAGFCAPMERDRIISVINRDYNRFAVPDQHPRLREWLRHDIEKGILAKGGRHYYDQGDARGCLLYYPLLYHTPEFLLNRVLRMSVDCLTDYQYTNWFSANITSVEIATGKKDLIQNYKSLTCFVLFKMNYTHIQESKFLWILPYPIIDILQTSLYKDDSYCYLTSNKILWQNLLCNFEHRKNNFGDRDLLPTSEKRLRGRRINSLSSAISYAAIHDYLSIGGDTYRFLKKYLPEGFDYRHFC